jgi:hypothetical protein
VYVVDDSELVPRRPVDMLSGIEDVEIVGQTGNPEEAEAEIRSSVSLHVDVGIGQTLLVEGRPGAQPGKGNSLREKEKKMKKHIGLVALAVLTAFTMGFAPGLAQAGPSLYPIQEGLVKIPGTVEMGPSGYVLKSSQGTFRLAGADASKLVGQKVKAWGELTKEPGTDRETINVDQFDRS